MTRRDVYVVLTLALAAFVWRWFVALRTPMPGIAACEDLWCAQQLAHGSFAALRAHWQAPLWPLLLAPAIAAGAAPFFAAQLAACVCGSLVVWPVAAAAERLRAGAGVPAAVAAMVAAGPSVAAGMANGAAVSGLVVGGAAWALACERRWLAALLALVAVGSAADSGTADEGALRVLRLAVGAVPLLAALAVRSPRIRQLRWFAGAVVVVAIVAAVDRRPTAWLPTWAPLLAVLAGVGVAGLSRWWREALLCVVVAVECHGAWHEIEPAEARIERHLGRHLARRRHGEQRVVSDLPRVLWAADQRPLAATGAQLAEAALAPDVFAVVLGPELAGSATLAASLAAAFQRYELPGELAELAAARHLRVSIRR